MKRLLTLLALLPALAQAAPYDLVIQQRNATDTGLAPNRFVAEPPGGANGIMGYNGATHLPLHWTIGTGLGLTAGALVALPQAWTDITGKPAFAAVATSGSYLDLSNRPTIPASQVQTDWNATTGLGVLLNKPALAPIATTGSASDISTGTVATARLPALSISQTTGLQTALDGKFPVPTGSTAQYIRGDGSLATLPAPGTGTVTSITAGTGLSGGTITTTGTISMPNTGTAGTYSSVTTDAQGRVTAGTALSINDAPARTLVTTTSATGFQISVTRVAEVCYEGSFSTTSTIGGPSSASVFLETADTNSTTPGDWTIKAQQTYTNTITLAVVLNQVQGNNWSFCRVIPAGKFVRLRAGSITGTASASLNTTQQEVLR